MDIIKDLVQTLIIIVVLAVFLEMFLPRGKMMPYVKMVMGLLIIIAVLQAISGLLRQNWFQDVPGVKARVEGPAPPLEEIMTAGKQLEYKNRDLALENYREGISRQIQALARLNPRAGVVDAEVELSKEPGEKYYGKIKKITLIVKPSAREGEITGQGGSDIQPVHIKVGETPLKEEERKGREISPEIKKAAREVADSIADFYNLSPDEISIEYKN